MPALIEALAGNLVVANLGASGDGDYPWPAEILQAVTLIEIDGDDAPILSQAQYHAKHRLQQVIAGDTTPRTFKHRAHVAGSSILEPRPEQVEKYGLQAFYALRAISEVHPTTLPAILPQLQIEQIDFLKTDLEGLDLEVLQSLGSYLDNVLVVQCELRMEQFLQGEPYFFEIAQFLYAHNFELVGLKQEMWRPQSPGYGEQLDGVVAWADALFMKTPAALAGAAPLVLAKHVLLAALLGKKSYGAWLLAGYQAALPEAWQIDLRARLRPQRSFRQGWARLKTSLEDCLYVTPLWSGWVKVKQRLKPYPPPPVHVLRSGIDH